MARTGEWLYVEVSASEARRRLKGRGFGVRRIETAGKNRAAILHTAVGIHLRQLESLFHDALSKKEQEVFGLLIEAITALQRENKDVLWGSMIKQTMQRKRPSFNEGYYGYSTFSDLLEDAEKKNIVKLKKDQRSGSYIVTGFAGKHGNRR